VSGRERASDPDFRTSFSKCLPEEEPVFEAHSRKQEASLMEEVKTKKADQIRQN